jgi:arsenate reductase
MAEAFLKYYGSDKYEVYSAGLEPRGIHPLTKVVMDEMGIDLSNHSSKSLAEYLGKKHFGYVVTVCSQADKQCPAVFPGMGQRLHWDFEDPSGFIGTREQQTEKFREIREQIREKIKSWIKE